MKRFLSVFGLTTCLGMLFVFASLGPETDVLADEQKKKDNIIQLAQTNKNP